MRGRRDGPHGTTERWDAKMSRAATDARACRLAFRHFDTAGSSKISRKDFVRLMVRGSCMSKDQAVEAFKVLNLSGNGSLSYDECA